MPTSVAMMTAPVRAPASRAGKCSRTMMAYEGTMPPWNRPNSADATYSGTSPAVGRNISSATPCSAEPSSSTRTPPMWSQIPPDTSRLAMPLASMGESISAPRAAPKPRSVQYATMCTCGTAMATQQATPATHSSAWACAGARPKGRSGGHGVVRCALAASGVADGSAGGGRRMHSASSAMPRPHSNPCAT